MDEASKHREDAIRIPRKAFLGIAPAIAILGVLVSKGDIGPLLLFIVGVGAGVLIGKGWFENRA